MKEEAATTHIGLAKNVETYLTNIYANSTRLTVSTLLLFFCSDHSHEFYNIGHKPFDLDHKLCDL